MMARTVNSALSKLQRGRVEHVVGGPTELIAHVTDSCTLACAMCMNASQPPDWPSEAWHVPTEDMSVDVVRRLLVRFPDARSICFAGVGEPLMAEGIEEMVRFAHDDGRTTSLVSNGTLLRSHSKWITSGILDVLEVSVNAHDADSMKGICGGDEQALEALRDGVATVMAERAGRPKPEVTMSAVLWRGRQDEARKLLELAVEMGIRDVHFHNLIPSSLEGFGPERVLTTSDREWVRSLGEEGAAWDLRLTPPLLLDATASPRPCHSPWRVAYVDSNGGVSGCFRVEAPSLDNGDWGDPGLWNGEYFRRSRAAQLGSHETTADPRCEMCVERRGTPAW